MTFISKGSSRLGLQFRFYNNCLDKLYRCCYRVHYKPCDINHWTAASSAKWSCGRPPYSLVCGQLLKIWYETLFDCCHSDIATSCKAPLSVAGCTVTMISLKVVYFWQVSSRQIESWLPDSGVIHKGRFDHPRRLPVILPLTGDVYRMSVCPERSVWWQLQEGENTYLCTAILHVGLSSQSACLLQLCIWELEAWCLPELVARAMMQSTRSQW